MLRHFLKIGLEDLRDNAKLVQNSRSPAAIRNRRLRNSIPERCRCVKQKEKADITSFEAYSGKIVILNHDWNRIDFSPLIDVLKWYIGKDGFVAGVYDTLVSIKLTRLRHVFRYPQHAGDGGVAAPARRASIRYCMYPN